MSLAYEDIEAQGSCQDLPMAVADKYFFANGNTDLFNHRVARAICGNCAIQLACLTDAIEAGFVGGVRGGEAENTVIELHRESRRTGTPAVEIARLAIEKQPPIGGLRRGHKLQAGHFKDVRLAVPEQRKVRR